MKDLGVSDRHAELTDWDSEASLSGRHHRDKSSARIVEGLTKNKCNSVGDLHVYGRSAFSWGVEDDHVNRTATEVWDSSGEGRRNFGGEKSYGSPDHANVFCRRAGGADASGHQR
jgi:hypothetical protein